MKTKQTLSLALALAMLLSLCPITAMAATTTDEKWFRFDNGTITKYNPNGLADAPKDVVIPATIGGQAVTTIGNSAFLSSGITSVVIPKGVTRIDHSAFNNCNALVSVTIPEGVQCIGGNAFNNCDALTSVTFPEGMTTIDGGAFANCDKLASVVIPKSLTNIGGGAFSECPALASIDLPEGVETININTFNGCTALKSITIPASVTTVDYLAFANCTALASVTFLSQPEIIGDEDEDVFENVGSVVPCTLILPADWKGEPEEGDDVKWMGGEFGEVTHIHTYTGDYVTDDAHPGKHGQKCIKDGCGEVGNWTDHVFTDGVCVCGAVDGWVWEEQPEDCQITLFATFHNLTNYAEYNKLYLLMSDDFYDWKQRDNTLAGLADKCFVSAIGKDFGDGEITACYYDGPEDGEFTKLPSKTNEGYFILPAAMGSGEESIPVVLVLSNGTEYYYATQDISRATMDEEKNVYAVPDIYAEDVSPTKFTHIHAFTGDYVFGEGEHEGQHGRKCACGEVGNWTDHVYTDGKCVCGEAEPLDASDFAALIGESFTSPEHWGGGAYVCHVVFEESGVRFYEERTSDHWVMVEFTASYEDIAKTEEGWEASCEVSTRWAYLEGSFTEGPTCADLHFEIEEYFDEFTHVHHYDKYSVNEAEHPGKHQEICGFCGAPDQWVDHEFKDDRCVCGAWATHVHEGISFAPISSFEELRQLCDHTGGAGYLTADITLDEGSSLTVDQTVQLDLNGKVLNLNGKNITVSSNGVLEVYDCKSETVHTFGDDDGLWLWDDTLTGNAVKHSVTGGLITGGRAKQGGGLSINGSVTMHGINVCGNKVLETATSGTAIYGGGVYVTSSGSLTMDGGSICGNFASYWGGGLYLDGGKVELKGTRIEQNVAGSHGGGVYSRRNNGSLTMNGGSLSDNVSKSYGGGIFIYGGSVTAVNCRISGNEAQYGGGGVEIESSGSKLTLINSSVTENNVVETAKGTAANQHKGGGVHYNNGDLILEGTVLITDNTCAGAESNLFLRHYNLQRSDNTRLLIEKMSQFSQVGVFSDYYENYVGTDPSYRPAFATAGETGEAGLLLTCFRLDALDSPFPQSLRATENNKIEFYPHEHKYAYAAPAPSFEEPYALTATCTEEGCATPYMVLTLTDDGLDGESVRSWMNVGGKKPTVTYYKEDGVTAIGSAKPTEDGSYVVKATVDGVTQSLPFDIVNGNEEAKAAYAAYVENKVAAVEAMRQESDSAAVKGFFDEAVAALQGRFYDEKISYAQNCLWIDLVVMAAEEKVAAQRLSEAKDAATDEILDASGFPDCSEEVKAMANKAMEDVLTAETVEEVNAILKKALADIAAQKEIDGSALIVGDKSDIFGAMPPVNETEEDEIIRRLKLGYALCENNADQLEDVDRLEVELKKVVTEKNGEAVKVTEIDYGVTPKDARGEKVEKPEKPVEFELPVTDDYGEYVKVEHEDEEFYAKASTKQKGDSWLVRVVKTVLSYFSDVKLTPAEAEFKPVALISNELGERYYATMDEAKKAAGEGDTIRIPEDIFDCSASLTLTENINVNFYVFFPKEARGLDASKLSVRSTFVGKTAETAPVRYHGKDTKDAYAYRAVVAEAFSYQMTEKVEIELLYDGEPVMNFDYSVRQYLEDAIKLHEGKNEALVALLKAACSYGGAAQRYFGGKSYVGGTYPKYTADQMADRTYQYDLSSAVKPEAGAMLDGEIEGVGNFGVSLVLGNEVAVNLHFSAKDIEGLTVNGEEPTDDGNGKYSYRVTGIQACELSSDVIFEIEKDDDSIKISYSPYVYAAQCWDDKQLGELCKALVAYGDCANAFFIR